MLNRKYDWKTLMNAQRYYADICTENDEYVLFMDGELVINNCGLAVEANGKA